MRELFDTNILIDNMKGIPDAIAKLNGSPDPSISIITWIEVLAGATSPKSEALIEDLLLNFEVVAVDERVARRAAVIRRERRLKLPDAIILATAQIENRILITRNTRDFPADEPGIHIPYQI